MYTASLHPSCILAHPLSPLKPGYIVYSEAVRTTTLFLREVSPVPPISLLLFGGRLHFDARASLVTLDDGWIRFRISTEVAQQIMTLRKQLDALLVRRWEQPDANTATGEAALIDGVVALFASEQAS